MHIPQAYCPSKMFYIKNNNILIIKLQGDRSYPIFFTIHPALVFFTCSSNRLKSYTRVNYTPCGIQWCTLPPSLSQKKLQEARFNLSKTATNGDQGVRLVVQDGAWTSFAKGLAAEQTFHSVTGVSNKPVCWKHFEPNYLSTNSV